MGNVVVDDVATEPTPPRLSPVWVGALAAAVVVGAALIPGGASDPPSTTLAVPEVVTAENRWRRLDLPADGFLTGVDRLADGSYVAVGSGPQIWTSEDGEIWTWALTGTPDPGRLTAVTASSDGPVAVGYTRPDDGGQRASIWHREDAEWRRAMTAPSAPSSLTGVIAANGQILAWGWAGSDRDFSPVSESILYASDDGVAWRPVPVPEDMHIDTVEWIPPRWYIGGYVVGRPAVWSSEDLEEWDRVPTDEMTFGWTIYDIVPQEPLVVTVLDLAGDTGMSQWARSSSGTWARIEEVPERPLYTVGDDSAATGEGQLWIHEAGTWRPLELGGRVEAVDGGVAVGTNDRFQPAVWVVDATSELAAEIPTMVTDRRWREVFDLGSVLPTGAWRVGDGWLIGSPTGWWLFEGNAVQPADPPWPWQEPPTTVQHVGDEWVALPHMAWTPDGLNWELRADPASSIGSEAEAVAIAALDDRLVAIGHDQGVFWQVAESTDGGHTWSVVEESAAATPRWGVVATVDGFAATAAGPRGTEQVVVSVDGRSWEPRGRGQILLSSSPVPVVAMGDSTYLLLDEDQTIEAPRPDVEAVYRDRDRLVVQAGGAAWISSEGAWIEVPMDPPHGVDGPALLMPLNGRLFALAAGPGSLRVLEWPD